MTPANVILEVRRAIQDMAAPYRNSDDMLLGMVNQTLKRMAQYRPDLFVTRQTLPLTPDDVYQSLPSTAIRLVAVIKNQNGNAVTEASREVLDRSVPDWPQHPSGSPVNFMRHPREPSKFFVYPPPNAGTSVEVDFVQAPPNYTLGATILAPNAAFFPVIVDGTVALVEAIDNEHAATGKAQATFGRFLEALGVGQSQRPVVDNDSAMVPRQ